MLPEKLLVKLRVKLLTQERLQSKKLVKLLSKVLSQSLNYSTLPTMLFQKAANTLTNLTVKSAVAETLLTEKLIPFVIPSTI